MNKVMNYSILTYSTYIPISLSEVKSHIRMQYGETREDDFLYSSIKASISKIENYLNRKLSPYTIKYYLDDFPSDEWIDLPFPPIRNIPSTGLVYTNSTQGSTTLSSTKWSQDIFTEPGRLVLDYNDDWPTGITLANNNPISVEYECGYGSTILGSIGSTNIDLPKDIKYAVLMTIASYYEAREDQVQSNFSFKEMPIGAKNLLYPYRIKTF